MVDQVERQEIEAQVGSPLEADPIDFSDTKFEAPFFAEGFVFPRVHFDSATFSGNANFRSATFSDNANFDSATFSDSARLRQRDLQAAPSTARASEARPSVAAPPLRERALQHLRRLLRERDLQLRRLPERDLQRHARFESATFSDIANFRSATFSGDANFDSATFSGDANFESATFSGIANFDSATFSGTLLSSATARARPSAARQLRERDLQRRRQLRERDLQRHRQLRSATFSGRAILPAARPSAGDANFVNAEMKDQTIRRCEVLGASECFDAKLHEGTTWHRCNGRRPHQIH